MTQIETISLQRLLKQAEAETLLTSCAPLLPEGHLVLVRPNGQVFSGAGLWPQAELAKLLAQNSDKQLVQNGDFIIAPLFIEETQLVGAIAARHSALAETVVRCLHTSVSAILTHALEKRNVIHETLERYREINVLYRLSETLGARLDADELAQLVLTEANMVIKADIGLALLSAIPDEAGSSLTLERKASFGLTTQSQTLNSVVSNAIGRVLESGHPAIITASSEDSSATPGSILCAPLKTQKQILGVILLERLAGQVEFTAGDEKLLMALTSQAAIAIETAWLHQQEVKRQRLEEELAIGRQIQLSLLPAACPVISGWEFAAVYKAARQVGGDLYDFFQLPDEPHRWGLVIADVTGKGVPAALFMAFSRTVIHLESMRGHSPATVLKYANKYFVSNMRSRLFLTAFYATLDVHQARLTYASGGHDRPLWLQAAAHKIESLAAQGFILGAFKDIELEECEIEIAPGDQLVFYTDGVTEARNSSGQLFGEERLQEVVLAHVDAGAEQLLHAIEDAVQSFTGTMPQSDDFTLFVVKRQKA